MTRSFGSRATPVAIATVVAGLCIAAAAVVLAIVSAGSPPIGEPSHRLEHAWFQVASGGILIPLALRLRRKEAYAFALLAGACLLAGWAMQELRYDAVSGRSLLWIDLLAGLALVPAPTAIVAAFASTPPRRLANLAPIVLAIVVGLSVVAVIGQSAIRERDASYSGIGQSLVDAFSSSLVTIAVVAVAALGSIRNEAKRFVATSELPRRDPAVPRRLGSFLIAALTVSVLVAAVGFQLPGAAEGQTLLPLLAALVAIIGVRWSAYISWAALAVSLAIGASIVFAGALDIEVQKIVEDPEAPWVPNALWLLLAGFSLIVAVLGVAAASSAFIEARKPGEERPDHTNRDPWTLTVAATGVAAWATAAWLVGGGAGLEAPLLEGPFWAVYMSIAVLSCLLVLGAAEALRGRLVPAIAEAEATARRPLRPFRYLETVAIETLTARAALRRSAMAAERSRLASDLHAQILPSLADIRARYESGAADADVAGRLRELEREVRDLMAERRLVVLEEFGIVEAIEWLVGRAEERASTDVHLSVDDRSTAVRPPREVERAAFRVAQLAVENALQHAAPSRLELQVLARSDEVRIAVVDDGPGLVSGSAHRERDHLGISDMRSQAAEVHGDVTVESPASGGTTVTFAWPGGVTAA